MKSIVVKVFLLFGAPIAIIKSASGQNSQPLGEFDRLVVKDNVKVEVVIADRYSIFMDGGIPADAALKINNQTIVLTNEQTKGRKVKLFVKNLSSVKVEDLASIESADTLTGSVSIKLEGKSKASLLLNVSNLLVDADDMSSLTLAGRATKASMKADGAASIKSEDLLCQELTVEADGAANAKVQSVLQLNAKVDGASNIRFTGDPQNRNFSVLGLGTIKGSKEGEEYDGSINTGKDIIAKDLMGDGDTTRVKIGKRKLMIIEDKKKEKDNTFGDDEESKTRKMKSVWGGFELGVQGFATPSLNFTMPSTHKFLESNIGSSWFFALNTPDWDGHIIKNKLALTTGLGILWSNIHFDGNDYLTPNADSLTATSPVAGTKLSLNKLYTFDITAPLLVKFAPGKGNKSKGGFHVAAGAILHYVATSRVVTETSSGGYNQRVEMTDDFNINPFRVDATVRMGYDRVKFFANYSLTPYFNTSKAPDVRLFSAGLTLIGF
jgi:hypothetical protein